VKHHKPSFVLLERRSIEPLLEASNQIFDDAARPHHFAIHDNSGRCVGDHFDVAASLGWQEGHRRGGPVTP
jgi:hypothetical protein